MAIADWFLKRTRRGRPRVDLDVAALMPWFAERVPRLEGRPIDADLLRARLADGYRDLGVAPPPPEVFPVLVEHFDAGSFRRLALLVGALDLEAVRQALPKLLDAGGVVEQVKKGFVWAARSTPLLTLELLRQSPLRLEEFTRHFIGRLGATVRGENLQQSLQRLEALDYGRLLEEAERAKVSAEERMAKLRQLQEEQERRRPRRGKW